MTDGHPQNTVNVTTFVPEGYVWVGSSPEDEAQIAQALIAAAGENYGSVMAQSGGFLVPADVAVTAGLAVQAPVEAPVEAPADPAPADAPAAPADAAPADVPDAPADPAPAPAKKTSKAAAAAADAPADTTDAPAAS